jgi:hypothetical protein
MLEEAPQDGTTESIFQASSELMKVEGRARVIVHLDLTSTFYEMSIA